MKTLTTYLKLAGMSQGELAQRCGIDQATISKLISGAMDPTPKNLLKIQEATGIKVARLVADFAKA